MSETSAAPLRVERSDGVVEVVLSAPERDNAISLDGAGAPGSRDAFVGHAVAAGAASPDGREGVAAFLERRAPRFGASGG